uniref:Reverse transcriptase domain-containing protein n=1 Tax=Takifugu rubripes TaxID=31033 RepID=A0A674NZ79_TAKRU
MIRRILVVVCFGRLLKLICVVKRREERTKLKQISDEIQLLDAQYSVNPSDVLYKKRVQLQSQYNLLTSGRIEKQLLHTKQRFFEQGDKAGKLLAYQARTEAASRLIPRIRGTRQGCPLSPLLFALAVEPLAIWLRSENGFEGITRHGQLHKISFYADDLLLYMSNPTSSLPVILDIFEKFGKYSGYKLNFGKSDYIPINSAADLLPQGLLPFRKASDGFKYLGILVTRSFSELFAKNYIPLIERCKSDLARWSSLPLSLIGRVNLIKMSILPQFLYLFQHIPVFIRKSFFSKLDQLISSFLWCNKRARIGRSALRLPKPLGGLALPDFRYYYWACNINNLLHWNTGKAELIHLHTHSISHTDTHTCTIFLSKYYVKKNITFECAHMSAYVRVSAHVCA